MFEIGCCSAACGIDPVDSVRYSVRSVTGVRVIDYLPVRGAGSAFPTGPVGHGGATGALPPLDGILARSARLPSPS
eukprot:10700565-Alexandrium_andersonii.AAC.1